MFGAGNKERIVLFFFLVAFNLPAQTGKIKFYLTASNNQSDLIKSGEQMKKLIEKETGLEMELEVPASHEELVSKFGDGKPCFGLLNSQSYVVANTKYGAKAKLRIIRYGTGLYYGMIVTKASSGIKSLKDLNGKTIAYTDQLSTSGYLYPKKLLEKKGVKPGKILFLNSHEEVITQVYTGKVDAGAAFYSPESSTKELRDARARVQKKFPDISKEVIILAKTDPIPNDPITFSKSINSELALKIAVAMVKIANTEEGKKLLKEMYGVEGLVRATDADYNSLRAVIVGN
ncbi:MAG: phosphate/phosphite/phosphonate ABC transporter substrate-binding protein [Bacteroidetes bacterium]|nr:phosphate/phosphite/phosphonate ABC transporter substrate-binding protein [Bacteroidota bacterium]MBI3482546.1 phosphate/phosphite/phosphonate ABC transporter substrate-binding protein [Bacteroidota bacterium]